MECSKGNLTSADTETTMMMSTQEDDTSYFD